MKKAALLLGLWGLSLSAQSFQTQFSEVKFDRSHGPASLHGAAQVEGASGSLHIRFPLGPGIGARGLKFQPALDGRFSPQASVEAYPIGSSVNPALLDVHNYRAKLTHNGGFTYGLSEFHLVTGGYMAPLASMGTGTDTAPMDTYQPPAVPTFLSSFEFPDGSSGSAQIAGPQKFEIPADVPTKAKLAGLLQAFGYGADWSISPTVYTPYQAYALAHPTEFLPTDLTEWEKAFEARLSEVSLHWQDGLPLLKDFIHMGSGGELILGLQGPSVTEKTVVPFKGGYSGEAWGRARGSLPSLDMGI